MSPLRNFCLLACLVATVLASPTSHQLNGQSKSLKPSEWLSPAKLESLASMDEFTLQKLESMSAEKGAELFREFYHLSQINHDITPSFVPSASNIPATIVKSDGQHRETTLNELVAKAKQEPNFGEDEVTIFITGVPQRTKAISKAFKKLVDAYQKRYNGQQQKPEQSDDNKDGTSSEENSGESWAKKSSGNLVVIDLGATITSFRRFAMLDVERTGDMIGKVIVQLTNELDVPQEMIHIVAQGVAAHVAGAAGRQYTRLTGHQLRRITALDPTNIFAHNIDTLVSLARGDAEFVDAIHTSAHGMGTLARVGDIDFFPNGPSVTVPGADNVVKASMRATLYFAESVIPGNERNFPAVAARSVQEYRNNNGYGKRAFMGINTDYDLEGDYILEVNPKAPFGKRAPAQKQNTYHGMHQPWKNQQSGMNSLDYA